MIGLINRIIAGLGSIAQGLLNLLPTSPFQVVQGIDLEWLQAINYLFPVSQAVAHLQLFVVAVAFYYALRAMLRWAKVVGD
ncbi:hypothetical protein KO465_06300 [Candidatus Micrarchaeota archaeon]|jgi:hypothetical protein|nr:hypothetical protein [Candidatus Micrarchaeota archaeon]